MVETVCPQMAYKSIYDHKDEVAKLITAAACHLRLIRDNASSSNVTLSSESDPKTDDEGTFSLYLNMKRNKAVAELALKLGRVSSSFPGSAGSSCAR